VLPARGSDSQVRVIGHPSGRGLSISVNKLLDHQTPKVHYRTATEGGSSGSPVFNQDWKLIGLHHAGGDAVPRLNGTEGTYEANEGIWIHSICQAIDQALP
jgi:V8-like Glu-specific endopeptidase